MDGGGDENTSLRVASFSCYLDTAKENLLHRISSQHYPPNYSKDCGLTNLRVDSFSYLNTAPEKFVFNVPHPIQDPTSFTFPQEPRRNGEISIFGADKYFSMKLDCQNMGVIKRDSNSEGPANLALTGSNSTPRAPSVCSEASSWNTQTALLQILQRNGSQTKQKKTIGIRRIFSGFGCKGPCFNRKGVQVSEQVVAPEAYYGSKPTRTGSERIDHLALPPNRGAENLPVKQKEEVANLEESRSSIEVFGSGATILKGDVAKNMERKLSVLTWDAIPKAKNLPTSTVGSATICDDMASEASSDLFEIENISGSMHPILTTDDIMSMSPSSHYAPSEASIQWSVVTASAADYPASDYNEESVDLIVPKNNSNSCKSRNGGGKETEKSRNGGLLGCKSLKSVDVAEIKVSHKANHELIKAKDHQGLEFSFSNPNSQKR